MESPKEKHYIINILSLCEKCVLVCIIPVFVNIFRPIKFKLNLITEFLNYVGRSRE